MTKERVENNNLSVSEREQLAKEFLQFLTSDVPSNTFLSITQYLYSPDDDGGYVRSYHYPVTSVDEVAGKVVLFCDGNKSDIYVRCSVLKEKPEKGRGKKEQTAGSSVLWVDLDAKDGKTQAQLLERLRQFLLPPSWVNISGNGIHAYWKLFEFVTDIIAIEKRNKWLADQLGGDHCWNITQVLRIPGTRNYKDPTEVKEVSVVKGFLNTRRYNLEDIPEADVTTEDRELDLSLEEEPLPEDFLEKLPEKLQQRILTGEGAPTKEDGRIDRSENDWYIVMQLLELGYTSGQCLTVLTHPQWFSGEKTRERKTFDYATYTVAKAVSVYQQEGRTLEDYRLLLDPVIEQVLFYDDERGISKKRKIRRGAELVNPVVKFLRSHGEKFYLDEEERTGYIATSEGRVLVADKDGSEFRDWIQQISGFTDEEQEHRILRSGIAAQVREAGEVAKLTPWCFLDVNNWAFYTLLDIRGRTVLKVPAGKEPTIVPNGTDKKLLRRSGQVIKPIQYDGKVNIGEGLRYFINNFTQWIATDKVSRGILTCYALATPLVYGFPIQTYPLIHLVGQAGGGKSQTLMLISSWLHGGPRLLNTTPAASYRIASKEVLLPFDDYERLPDDAKQFVLTAVTGITRQKSGKGTDDVVSQFAHVLMALTSISALEEEAVRRRALVIDINKERFPTGGYSENHWKLISDKRSLLWSTYARWLSQDVLPVLQNTNFNALTKEVEALIPLDVFRGLAPFITLMWVVGRELEKYMPGVLGLDKLELTSGVRKWVTILHLSDIEEITDRRPLLSAIQTVFEVYNSRPEGTILDIAVSREGEYEYKKRIVESNLRDTDYRLHITPPDKLPQDGAWIGLDGSTTEWMSTLKKATSGIFKVSGVESLGHQFKQLVGDEPVFLSGNKESEPIDRWDYRFVKLDNAGPGMSQKGWRVLMRVEE